MEDSRWKFDPKFLRNTIKNSERLLKDKHISESFRNLLQEYIYQLSNFEDAVCDRCISDESEPNMTFNSKNVSNRFLKKARRDYYTIGKNMLDSMIYLNDNFTYVCIPKNNNHFKTTPSEIVDRSLEIYDEYLPEFYHDAKEIVDNPIHLINFTKKETIGSLCFYSEILKLPFINIDNYEVFPNSFIHEIEHAVELVRNYNTNKYLQELGPILFETIYIDKLVKGRVPNAALSYCERLFEMETCLNYVSCYAKCLKILRKDNFCFKNEELISILKQCALIGKSKMDLEQVLSYNFNLDIMYIFSFIKSLELRKLMYQSKEIGVKTLIDILSSKRSEYLLSDKALDNCEEYLKEIINKQKNYPHNEDKKYVKHL